VFDIMARVMSVIPAPFTVEALAKAVDHEIGTPVDIEVLPPVLGPEITGLSIISEGRAQVFSPAAPEWLWRVSISRQLAHLILNHERLDPPSSPSYLGDDEDGELLGILLADGLEQLIAREEGVREPSSTVSEHLDLLVPLRARLVDLTPQPAVWPAALTAEPSPGEAEAYYRRQRQRVLTDIYDACRSLARYLPRTVPSRAHEALRDTGLPERVVCAAADQVCLKVAQAALDAGASCATAAESLLEASLTGHTSAQAAARLATCLRLVEPDPVRRTIDEVADHLAGKVLLDLTG
jgi:hypothetical protein